VWVLRAEFGRILDKHDALSWIDERQQRRQDRRLSRTGATRHDESKTAPHKAAQQFGGRVRQSTGSDQLVEAETAARRES
jgi:hypothetical protein